MTTRRLAAILAADGGLLVDDGEGRGWDAPTRRLTGAWEMIDP
jgi:hypothetical protein